MNSFSIDIYKSTTNYKSKTGEVHEFNKWKFDDAERGIVGEPFVAGATKMIDKYLSKKGLSYLQKNIRIHFSLDVIEDYDIKLEVTEKVYPLSESKLKSTFGSDYLSHYMNVYEYDKKNESYSFDEHIDSSLCCNDKEETVQEEVYPEWLKELSSEKTVGELLEDNYKEPYDSRYEDQYKEHEENIVLEVDVIKDVLEVTHNEENPTSAYYVDEEGDECWLCPAQLKFFSKVANTIYAKIEKIDSKHEQKRNISLEKKI